MIKERESHPKEMYLLALIEMCQRFAVWGIGNLLVLYLVGSFHFTDAKADQLYGLYSGVAFILPLFGGFIADKTNHFAAVIIGCLLTACGCIILAVGHVDLLYLALGFAALGAGLFTPSVYTILGRVYHDKNHLREGGFSIYYAAVNLGVFLAIFSMGSLGSSGYWSLAFILAAAVQFIGLILFLYVKKRPLFNPPYAPTKNIAPSHQLKHTDRSRIFVIIMLSLVSLVFWIAYNQGWSSMSIFALNFTDKKIGNFEMPASWLLSVESLYLVILAYPLAYLYRYLSKHRCDPNPIVKTIFSLVAIGLCFLLMAFGSRHISHGATSGSISPLYPLISYFLMAVGEMLLAPIGLSLVTHLSPHRYTALLVGVWYVCVGIAYYLGGVLAGFMSSFTSLTDFFDTFTISCFGIAFVLACFAKKLNRMRHIA